MAWQPRGTDKCTATHTHALTHTLTQVHSHTCIHVRSGTCPHSHTCIRAHSALTYMHSHMCLHAHTLILSYTQVLISRSWLQSLRFTPPKLHVSMKHFSRPPYNLPEPQAVCPTTGARCPAKSRVLDVSWQGQYGLQAFNGGRGSHESRRGQEGTEWLPSPQTSNPVEASSQTGRAPAVAPESADTGRQPWGAGPLGGGGSPAGCGIWAEESCRMGILSGTCVPRPGCWGRSGRKKGCPNLVAHPAPAFP